MTVDISKLKARLEADNLHLLFAAESGSRAWGFQSPDSDYDVRFIFAKSLNGYLVIHDSLKTLRFEEDGDLYDYSGWDIRKALVLAQKSNPALLEWLRSPIIYADEYGFQGKLLDVMYELFSPKALVHHYVNFAKNNSKGHLHEVFDGDHTCKEYLYALRPILCIMWMQMHPMRMPPVRLLDITTAMTLQHELKGEINRLLRFKMVSPEKELYRSTYLNEFITSWFRDNENITEKFEERLVPTDLLNNLLAETVTQLK
jgi:uncharacterized protein